MGVLDGRVAIVTGSARGIGRATAELLAARRPGGHDDLERDLAEQTAAEIGGGPSSSGSPSRSGRPPTNSVHGQVLMITGGIATGMAS